MSRGSWGDRNVGDGLMIVPILGLVRQGEAGSGERWLG